MYGIQHFLLILILISTHSNNSPSFLINVSKLDSPPPPPLFMFTINVVLCKAHHTHPLHSYSHHPLTLLALTAYGRAYPPSLPSTKPYMFNSYYSFFSWTSDYKHKYCDKNIMRDKTRRNSNARFHPFNQGWFYFLK